MIKRKEFEHENEIRIIFHDNAQKEMACTLHDGKRAVKYVIKPAFIDELVADPRMDKDTFQCLESTLISKGFTIKQSGLYKLPPDLHLKW